MFRSREGPSRASGASAPKVGDRARHREAGRRAARHRNESLRSWVRQADIDDGAKPGLSREDAEKIKRLEQENRELKCTNEILRKASAYFAQAELDRPSK